MAGFWKALKNTFREKKDQAAEKMSDPVRDGKYAIEDSKAKLAEIKGSIAKYSAQIKSNEKKLVTAQEQVKKWGNMAKKAAEAGNEDDVRSYLTNKAQAQAQVDNYKKQIASDTAYLNKMKSQWQQKNNKVSQAESNHAQLAVRKQMAEARKEFAKGSQGLDSDSCFADLDKLQTAVNADEAEAEAWEELEPVDEMEDAESKYGSTSDSAVDDEVAKLMAAAKK